MKDFEALLSAHAKAIEYYIRCRIPNPADAEDIYQEVCTAGFQKLHQLRDRAQFKAWMLTITRNRCLDYFRRRPQEALSLEEVPEQSLTGIHGKTVFPLVEETMLRLPRQDQEILDLYFWQELPQTDIAVRLGIPLGTVKSRLHTAKAHFRKQYPEKGTNMTKLPKILPTYTITPSHLPPFPVRWEECMGWFIVPKAGEKLHWGIYEHPDRKRAEWTECRVAGRAEIHGIRGVEIIADQHDVEDKFGTGSYDADPWHFVVQLTETHCRFLAESHMDHDLKISHTFLDGDSFLMNWGFGPDNCGTEIDQHPRGLITRDSDGFRTHGGTECMDIVGRYTVTMAGKTYDTVCLMDVESYDDAVATMQYLDVQGRTVLWRRFNRHDWHRRDWTALLPENERIIINGETYVHWYDCITSYIL